MMVIGARIILAPIRKHGGKTMNTVVNIIKFTDRFLRKYRFRIGIYLLCGAALFGTGVIEPFIIGKFIDSLSGGIDIHMTIKFAVLILVISILELLLSYYVKIEGTRMSMRTSSKIKGDIFMHMQKISPLKMPNEEIATLSKRINNDSEYLMIYLLNLGMQFPGQLIGFVVTLFYMFIYSKPVFMIVLIMIPLLWLFHKKNKDEIYEKASEEEASHSRFFAVMHEQLEKLNTVRDNAIFELMHNRFEKAYILSEKTSMAYEKKSFGYKLISRNADIILKAILFGFGTYSIIKNDMTIGVFTVLYSYLGMVSGYITYFLEVGQETCKYKVYYDRLKDLCEIREEHIGKEEIAGIEKIEVKDLTFGYKDEKKILKNFNYTLNRGKVYCIKGDNGTGKSTLMKNILGLYVDESGNNILYNDKPINELDLYDLRSNKFGVCEQEPDMLNDTIYGNILQDEKDFDLNRFKEICHGLSLFTDITDIKEFEDKLNEDADILSGGQKQKLVLARVFYKNPEVIVMDEPTSALDKVGISSLIAYLKRIKKDKIIFMISHDQSLIEAADEIVAV